MSTVPANRFSREREQMVQLIRRRGVRDEAVLRAMSTVHREAFVPAAELARSYQDSPLPIGQGQTISQPYVVALMTAALELDPSDRVLEIGTGSGYAAAVLAAIVREVYTVERFSDLAVEAQQRLDEEGFENALVRQGDGTTGWPEHAPYDAIIVAAGGPEIPPSLMDQLAIGGRFVIPVGADSSSQKLLRVTKTGEDTEFRENLGSVRFVPLVGSEGWQNEQGTLRATTKPRPSTSPGRAKSAEPLTQQIREAAESFEDIDSVDLSGLLDRIGDSRLVLIGESTHGTSEFYRLRARITQALIRRRGFQFVAIEADWPDAARINRYVRPPESSGRGASDRDHGSADRPPWQAFSRFPTWMWRNEETLAFIKWLRQHNKGQNDTVGFYGLDLYSMYTSITEVLAYLDRVDPAAAELARQRYGCLSPWEGRPEHYGRASLSSAETRCEEAVSEMLRDLMRRRAAYIQADGLQYFDATENARLIADAEAYYRRIYQGSIESWNLRDTHMFETLRALCKQYGENSKGIVWEHNSHLGDARATEMGQEGQLNVGQLCRERWGDQVYLIGQGTDHGTVAAASTWGEPHEDRDIRPAIPSSIERLCHESDLPRFLLPLRNANDGFRERLAAPMMQRAIGVVYRPQTERQSHYFRSSLSHQFDEWIWMDETSSVRSLGDEKTGDFPAGHPFSLIDE